MNCSLSNFTLTLHTHYLFFMVRVLNFNDRILTLTWLLERSTGGNQVKYPCIKSNLNDCHYAKTIGLVRMID